MPIVTEPSLARGSVTTSNLDSNTLKMTRGRAVEKVWPYCFAIGGLIVYAFYWKPNHPLAPNFRDVLTPMVGFGGSLAGFMLAAASVLITVRDRESSWYVKRAKEAGV